MLIWDSARLSVGFTVVRPPPYGMSYEASGKLSCASRVMARTRHILSPAVARGRHRARRAVAERLVKTVGGCICSVKDVAPQGLRHGYVRSWASSRMMSLDGFQLDWWTGYFNQNASRQAMLVALYVLICEICCILRNPVRARAGRPCGCASMAN